MSLKTLYTHITLYLRTHFSSYLSIVKIIFVSFLLQLNTSLYMFILTFVYLLHLICTSQLDSAYFHRIRATVFLHLSIISYDNEYKTAYLSDSDAANYRVMKNLREVVLNNCCLLSKWPSFVCPLYFLVFLVIHCEKYPAL